ncbi:MAG: GntR family transcriptional regulator [Caulobacteraceae bacterium]|nr:GntR family transcriptional regulator [Caulobacteraceae bacterium]
MQFSPHLADRPNLSDSLADAVRTMIVDGRLAAGARVNEVHLAAALKVSRTPLREALSRLTAEGALQAVPRRGYFVAPLTASELEQLYDLRPLLDPEALRLAGVPGPGRLQTLDAINARLARESTPEKIVALDDVWHLELIAGCPNRVLVEMIEQIMRRTRRYELALMREAPPAEKAVDHHAAVTAALRSGDLDGACAALKANLTHGREPLLAWLRDRERRRA